MAEPSLFQKEISLVRKSKCTSCEGTGKYSGDTQEEIFEEYTQCSDCYGSGFKEGKYIRNISVAMRRDE